MGRYHSLRIKRQYYDLIDAGKKTLEVRVGYFQIKKIQKGDIITFDEYSSCKYRVVRVTRYEDFATMLDNEDSQKIIPGVSKYVALQKLQAIYLEDKEQLGVYVFELTKDIKPKIMSARELAQKDHKTFAKLVAKAYGITDCICEDYPNHFNWYWSKTVPAVLNGTREILVCVVDKHIVGVTFLKKEADESKICTFLVLEEYRNKGIATALLERAFEFLETTKPLITIADYKIMMFESIIKKYGWEQTQILDKGYYNNTSREFVFNGKIS